MIEIDPVTLISQTGFPIGVSIWLLWKGYTQDREYLKALQDLTACMREHMRQKDQLVEMLRK